MGIKIEFSTDNAAFDDGSLPNEVENILDKVKTAFDGARLFDGSFAEKLTDTTYARAICCAV